MMYRVGMAENVKDPIAARLSRDVLGTAQEWLRHMDIPDTTYGQDDVVCRVTWMDDGTVRLESKYSGASVDAHYRVTVVVEPVDNWRPGTWREVALQVASGLDEVWVRLGGVEAQVESAGIVEWAVDPNSNQYRPTALPHATVNVLLAGRDQRFSFPPDGAVEILSPPMGPALQLLLDSFQAEPVKP